MRVRKALFAGAAALALAGFAGFAEAKRPLLHTMTVQLPNGGVARVTYSGDTPPKVAVSGERSPFVGFELWTEDPAFAQMDRVFAQMDRRMDALIRQANEMAAQTSAPDLARISSGVGGVCMQSVEITQRGSEPPRVVRHSYGCGEQSAPSAQAVAPLRRPPFDGLVQTHAVAAPASHREALQRAGAMTALGARAPAMLSRRWAPIAQLDRAPAF